MQNKKKAETQDQNSGRETIKPYNNKRLRKQSPQNNEKHKKNNKKRIQDK